MDQRLLICADWFDPGVRAGGPIRSCVNLVLLLGGEAKIALITSNRDLGTAEPYHGIPADRWLNWRGKARVRYCSSTLRRILAFPGALKRFQPSVVYLNSMFSINGTLWPLLWLWLTRHLARVVLAPRGMLKPSALNQKSWKKSPLIWLLRITGALRRVVFHATSDAEVDEIQRAFGGVSVRVIPNVPCLPVADLPGHSKLPGQARLCFVGRVHPIKNLLWLIRLMKPLTTQCQLTVIGPIEDQAYYSQCQMAVTELPAHVTVEFIGVQSEADVRQHLIRCDAMLLPTLGENFGHAIFEALAVGTPVIISDRTIWRELESQKAGWDLSLEDSGRFAAAIEKLCAMDDKEHNTWRSGALGVGMQFLNANNFSKQYRDLFFESV